MKGYEAASDYQLTKRSYVMVRVDGKAFKTFTKHLTRPFDDGFMEDMDAVAAYLCKNMMGAKLAFVQSDEISVLLTDFESVSSEPWFDNGVQKMCSVSASMATMMFNKGRVKRLGAAYTKWAEFDSRVFVLPSRSEVENYFIWRQQDTTRNSILSVARFLYSQPELNGKGVDAMQEMIFRKGVNWNDYAPRYKRGRVVLKEQYEKAPDIDVLNSSSTVRTRWAVTDVPVFTQDKGLLSNLLPINS